MAVFRVMMEAVTSYETSVNVYRFHGATSQKTIIFILVAVRTSNVTYVKSSDYY
jgi:hypothetical protein